MGVVSGLSIVGKRIDQDHAAAPPRSRSIVGTTAIGRAKKTTTTIFLPLYILSLRPIASSNQPRPQTFFRIRAGLEVDLGSII